MFQLQSDYVLPCNAMWCSMILLHILGGNRIWPKPGYWNPNEFSNINRISSCSPPAEERCIGGRDHACGMGYEGKYNIMLNNVFECLISCFILWVKQKLTSKGVVMHTIDAWMYSSIFPFMRIFWLSHDMMSLRWSLCSMFPWILYWWYLLSFLSF